MTTETKTPPAEDINKVAVAKAAAAQLEKEELEQVTAEVNELLAKRGYGLSARMLLTPGLAPQIETFLYKL